MESAEFSDNPQELPSNHGTGSMRTADSRHLSDGGSTANGVEKRNIWFEIAAKLQKLQLKELMPTMANASLTPAEKLNAIIDECLRQTEKLNMIEKDLLEIQRKHEVAQKERDEVCAEVAKEHGRRQTLENLCRELQRQKQDLTEKYQKLEIEEQQRRSDLSRSHGSAIKVESDKARDLLEEQRRLTDEKKVLLRKVSQVEEAYEIGQRHYAMQLRSLDSEKQLLEAKMKKQMLLFEEEAEKARLTSEQLILLQKQEVELKSQLATYGDKFEQFQETLTKSNEVFNKFKQEIEKMTKTIKRLEKDNTALKLKCEKSDVSIIELLDENQSLKKKLTTATAQKDKLESLCRTLQTERKLRT